MIDYSKIETTTAEPDPESMIETFRAIGYSIEAAIADIVDNSLSAEAKNIWLDYDWNGPDTILSIADDGTGMDEEGLIRAMKPGSVSPLAIRSESDLGRFGLGLKTASFSQCRQFSVISKTASTPVVYWGWDLNFVSQVKSWRLVRYCPDIEKYQKKLNALKSGTIVIWSEMDRLTKNSSAENQTSKAKFLDVMDRTKRHLSMVFHRYLESGVNIYFRGRLIEPWDPFMIGCEGLQAKPESVLDEGSVRIKGFILPHRSKLTAEQYKYGKGPEDSWTAHQGFYVYRNRRLLVAGSWLGLFKKEVQYDLCRIRVDLPNYTDAEWQIDIKKSVARIPLRIRDHFLSVAKESRSQALEVYRHKGKIIKRSLASDKYFPLWEERTRHGKRFYKLNRRHPILAGLFNEGEEVTGKIEKLLRFIEETIPVPMITLQENENKLPHGQPFEGIDQNQVKETMRLFFKNFINEGLSVENARNRLQNIEPFNFFPEYIEILSNEY